MKSEKLMMKEGEGSKEARMELSNSWAVGLASNRRICNNLDENKICGQMLVSEEMRGLANVEVFF